MSLDATKPEDGDGLTTGVRVNELAGHIRQLKTDLNNGKLEVIGNDTGTSKVIVNPDGSVSVYTNSLERIKVLNNGIINYPYQSGCEAKLNADQTIPSGTWTKLNLIKVWDLQGEFDDTNHRWTCTEDGKYLIIYDVRIDSLTSGKALEGIIRKNGSNFRGQTIIYTAAGGALGISASMILDLVSSNYIELFVYHNYGSDRTAYNTGTSNSNYLNIFKLS